MYIYIYILRRTECVFHEQGVDCGWHGFVSLSGLTRVNPEGTI